jgi:hypothetical protein
MDMKGDKDRLLSPSDLAERWQCSVGTVMDRVRGRGVPYLWLGKGEPNLTSRGTKLIRFRPKAVEIWEAQQEGYWAPADVSSAPRLTPTAGLLRGQKAKRN